MAHWIIPLWIPGQVHSLDYDWFSAYEWVYIYIYIYIPAFTLVVLQGLC